MTLTIHNTGRFLQPRARHAFAALIALVPASATSLAIADDDGFFDQPTYFSDHVFGMPRSEEERFHSYLSQEDEPWRFPDRMGWTDSYEPRYPEMQTTQGPHTASARENAETVYRLVQSEHSATAELLWLNAVGGVWTPFADEEIGPWPYNSYGLEFGAAGNYNFAVTGFILYRTILDKNGLSFVPDIAVETYLRAGSAIYQLTRGDRSQPLTWYGEDVNDVRYLDLGFQRAKELLNEFRQLPPASATSPGAWP